MRPYGNDSQEPPVKKWPLPTEAMGGNMQRLTQVEKEDSNSRGRTVTGEGFASSPGRLLAGLGRVAFGLFGRDLEGPNFLLYKEGSDRRCQVWSFKCESENLVLNYPFDRLADVLP